MNIPESAARRYSASAGDGGGLTLPDVAGLTTCEAALAYAEAGWYVLPTDPSDIKSPGSVVGGRWHEKSTRDPEQIHQWFMGNPDYGIALHCGRSGAVAFDLDIGSLGPLPGWMAGALASATTIQGTRRDGDRAHYIFAMPPGTEFGNGAGAFGPFGQVRGKNGVIIAAPTPHPDAETKNGEYRQIRTGPVGPLPEVLRECLAVAGETTNPLTDTELDAFLDTHTGGGCGREGCRHTVAGPVAQLRRRIADGESRHESLVVVVPWALSEASAGCYPAREVFGALHAAYIDHFDRSAEPERVVQLGDEYLRVVRWAAANADPARAHRNDELLSDAEVEGFWSARPELGRVQTFARARCVGPWSMFGAALTRVIATIPPHVVLPPTVGSEASLNLFVALVARSGFGKNTSEAAAEDFVAAETPVFVATPGSGEGILKQYAYVRKPKGQDPEQVNQRNAVMFSVGEVDTFAALAGRGGSTLMPELRKAWMGERLGFGWATVEKAVVVMPHRYRMVMVVGVQPGRGDALLRDVDGGTPQRFLWLPTTDPDAPEEPPEASDQLHLPAWPAPVGTPRQAGGPDAPELTAKFGAADEYMLHLPPDKATFHVLGLPPTVEEIVRREQRAKLRGSVPETEALGSHATLARLKVAAGLMWMNGRTDKVTEEDWDLAGVVMRVSDATRADVQAALKSNRAKADRARGRSDAEREVAKTEALEDKKLARVAERIRRMLRTTNDRPKAAFRRDFGRDKKHFDEALERLVAVGDVELETVEYQRQGGVRVRLREGR